MKWDVKSKKIGTNLYFDRLYGGTLKSVKNQGVGLRKRMSFLFQFTNLHMHYTMLNFHSNEILHDAAD